MCIRDRVSTPPTLLELTLTRDVPVAVARLLVTMASDQSSSCLLYTSDAADERSSVDLGGRRIIKKKKNSEQWSGGTETQNN